MPPTERLQPGLKSTSESCHATVHGRELTTRTATSRRMVGIAATFYLAMGTIEQRLRAHEASFLDEGKWSVAQHHDVVPEARETSSSVDMLVSLASKNPPWACCPFQSKTTPPGLRAVNSSWVWGASLRQVRTVGRLHPGKQERVPFRPSSTQANFDLGQFSF